MNLEAGGQGCEESTEKPSGFSTHYLSSAQPKVNGTNPERLQMAGKGCGGVPDRKKYFCRRDIFAGFNFRQVKKGRHGNARKAKRVISKLTAVGHKTNSTLHQLYPREEAMKKNLKEKDIKGGEELQRSSIEK